MPLRILMAVASEDDGGMARVAWLLARHLREFDVEVRAAVHREAPLTAWLRDAGIGYDVVPDLIETPTRTRPDGRDGIAAVAANLRGLPRAARALASLATRHDSRIIYSHNTWTHYVASAAAKSLRSGNPPRSVASVWHIHNDHSRRLTRIVDRAMIRRCGVAAIAAVSDSIGRPFAGLPATLTVVHNGIDVKACDAASRSPLLRRRLGLLDNDVVAVYAGRLVAHKGIYVLLEAARLAVPAMANLHVVVLGGSPRHERTDVAAQLRARVDGWGLSHRIHFPGHVPDVERHVADADLAVVPSTCADGCPLAAIEALCLGVPIVGSAIGGLPEIVRDGVDGILVPPGDAPALADAILGLARDANRRRRMAGAALAGARGRFDAVTMARRIAAVLQDAAAAQRSVV